MQNQNLYLFEKTIPVTVKINKIAAMIRMHMINFASLDFSSGSINSFICYTNIFMTSVLY